MEALEALKRTISVTGSLQSLVKTMKVLAGVNIRQYERAARAVAEYNRTIEMGLQIALQSLPEQALPPRHAPGRKLGAIIFGSDQGMCGQLNDAVVSHSLRALSKLALRRENQTLLAVGGRAASHLEAEGRTVEENLEVPASVSGIPAVVHDLLQRIEDWHGRRNIEMVVLFYCRPRSGHSFRPRGIRLLPVDLEWIRSLKAKRWPTPMIPMYTMDTEQLFHSLIREYLFVSLFRAFTESLASENASRLASVQIAERNIEDRLKGLSAEFRRSRRDSITSELLDIVSAFEALKGSEA
jgi:F-type H+-transporting ATPase subunit gamma